MQKIGHILEQLSLPTGTDSSKLKDIKEYNSRFKTHDFYQRTRHMIKLLILLHHKDHNP